MSSRPRSRTAKLSRDPLGERRLQDPTPHLIRTRRPPYRRTALVVGAYGFLVVALTLFLVRAAAFWSVGALIVGLGCGAGELWVQVRRFKASA